MKGTKILLMLVYLVCIGTIQQVLAADDATSSFLGASVIPAAAGDDGCYVKQIGLLGDRTFLKAIPAPGWRFDHWEEPSYLPETSFWAYVRPGDPPPQAVFSAHDLCSICDSAESIDPLVVRVDGFETPFALLDNWYAASDEEPGLQNHRIGHVAGTDGKHLRFGAEEDLYVMLVFNQPVNALSLPSDGIRVIARAQSTVLMDIGIESLDSEFLFPNEDERFKSCVTEAPIQLTPEWVSYDLPFDSFTTFGWNHYLYPYSNNHPSLENILEIKFFPHAGEGAIEIAEVSFYRILTDSSNKTVPTDATAALLGSPPRASSWTDIYSDNLDPEALLDSPAGILMSPTWWLTTPHDAHETGIQNIAGIGLWDLDGFASLSDLPMSLQDAYLRDINGNLILHDDGSGPPFLSFMHPAFRSWLAKICTAMVDDGTDAIWIDEPSGPVHAFAMGGPFDDPSVEAFRDYLSATYSRTELLQFGITDANGFDYREFIRDTGNVEQWFADPGEVPLADEYRLFLLEQRDVYLTELIDGVRSYAESQGRTVRISANQNPMELSDQTEFADLMDYFYYEFYHFLPNFTRADMDWYPAGLPAWPAFKHAVGRDQYMVEFPAGAERDALAEMPIHEATSLVLHWFAEAYANRGYCGSFLHWDLPELRLDESRLQDYYTFVRENPGIINDLESYATTAIIYPPKGHYTDEAYGLSLYLGDKHVAHDLIPLRKLSGYETVFAIGAAWSDEQVAELLGFVHQGGTAIIFGPEFASLDERFLQVSRPELLALKREGSHVYGSGTVTFFEAYMGRAYYRNRTDWVSAQMDNTVGSVLAGNSAIPNVVIESYRADSTLVFHVLNYEYAGGTFSTHSDVEIGVRLPAGLAFTPTHLKLLSPDLQDEDELAFLISDGVLRATLPELQVWSVLVLE